jgi:bacteriocin biosynthesis cyclodehydratase domain-containing protein
MSDSEKIAFRAHISRYILDSDRVLLVTEAGERFLLKGRLYPLLTSLLDGSLTMDEIAEKLGPEQGAERVYFALMTLQSKGFLGRPVRGIATAEAAFWQSFGVDDQQAQASLRETPVALCALGNAEKELAVLMSALEALEIRVSSEDTSAFTIVIVQDYLQPGLADRATALRHRRQPWVPVKIVGQTPWLGPVWMHNDGPCWACLTRRLHENRIAEIVVQRLGGGHPITSICSLPSTVNSAANIAATEIAKWIVDPQRGNLKDSVCTIDLLNLHIAHHPVQRLDDCAQCGKMFENRSEGLPNAARLVLRSRIKRHTSDGGHRSVLPQETFRQLEPLISPITGICPDLKKVDVSSGSNVYQIKQNVPLSEAVRQGTHLWKRDGAAGKGETDIQARVSCVAEAVERYSSIYRGNEPHINARLSDMNGAAIHPEDLLNFSKRQYQTRDQWNKTNPGFNWVPESFDESERIDWTPNWSLTYDTVRWLPTAYCYFSYESPDSKCFCRSDSNGLASGNNVEEAILQGFLELVERDAMALFWYNRIPRPFVQLDSFKSPYFDYMQSRHVELGRSIQILDITSDLGIPSFCAYSCNNSGGEISLGLGTHMDPRLAISRAISELNQMEPVVELWHKTPLEERSRSLDDQHIANWLENATIDNQLYLRPSESSPRKASDYDYSYERDVLADIRQCLKILQDRGMELIVLDMTRPDVGFPTVRVTVPGLRHFWARFAPGRLYDIPVRLGWLSQPRSEMDLNPFPLFL